MQFIFYSKLKALRDSGNLASCSILLHAMAIYPFVISSVSLEIISVKKQDLMKIMKSKVIAENILTYAYLTYHPLNMNFSGAFTSFKYIREKIPHKVNSAVFRFSNENYCHLAKGNRIE